MIVYFTISFVVFALLLVPAIRYKVQEYEYGKLDSFDYFKIASLSAFICVVVGVFWPFYLIAAALSYLAQRVHKTVK